MILVSPRPESSRGALSSRIRVAAKRARTGFTLLELLLASGIALLLMAGLYVAMEVNLNYAAAGREVVDQSQLARALLARISADISGALTPITATKSTSATSGTVVADEGTVNLTTVTPLNMGVVGDATVLTLYVSRVPKWTTPGMAASSNADQQQLAFSDLRRVSYWLSSVGDGGLAKQDVDRVTADRDDDPLPPGVPNEEKLIVATEVVGLAFRYFDGSSWQDSWDGSIIGEDGLTPVGPPRAIEIRIDIRKPNSNRDAENVIRSYRHVVAIGAANAQPTATTDTATTGTTTGTTTGGGP
jgi:prepilin-type N-terminal cleavage/methylation domain-containing protein